MFGKIQFPNGEVRNQNHTRSMHMSNTLSFICVINGCAHIKSHCMCLLFGILKWSIMLNPSIIMDNVIINFLLSLSITTWIGYLLELNGWNSHDNYLADVETPFYNYKSVAKMWDTSPNIVHLSLAFLTWQRQNQ